MADNFNHNAGHGSPSQGDFDRSLSPGVSEVDSHSHWSPSQGHAQTSEMSYLPDKTPTSPPPPAFHDSPIPVKDPNYNAYHDAPIAVDHDSMPIKDSKYHNQASPSDYHNAPEVVAGSYDYNNHNNNYFNQQQYPPGALSPGSHEQTPYSPNAPPYTAVPTKEEHEAQHEPVAAGKEQRTCGLKRRTFLAVLIALIVLAVLAIALGVGLGVGLKKKSSSSSDETNKGADPWCAANPTLCIGGYLDESYYSKKGAFNGSGIALAGESWNKGQKRIFTLYFQHWSGDIRYMTYDTQQNWNGGSSSETVASDAKNGTPISAVAYVQNTTQYFHLFYISKNNTLAQRTQDNITGLWTEGVLGKQNLGVYDNPTVGLQACYKGNYYGDSDATIFPGADGNRTLNATQTQNGMNIWYPIDDSTFQQYTWYPGQSEWVEVDKWQGKNVHAGVGCYSWDEWSTSTYTMMVNKNNDTEFWWKDTNTTEVSTSDHPINSWQNATTGAIDGVYPTTSMGYTTFFYTQMADRTIKGYNISYESENTHVEDANTFTITNPGGPVYGLPGTHMTVTAYAMMDDKGNTEWDSLYVFFQTGGDDITAFTRNIDGGQWSAGALAIPDD